MQYSQLYLAEYGFTKKAQIMPRYQIYWHNVYFVEINLKCELK